MAEPLVTRTIDLESKEEQVLELPIVVYPPFKLRSSLIDKDPVIWVHLLEEYIMLFRFLILMTTSRKYSHVKLSTKSLQQLQQFMKVYLYETSEETSRIFSLGAINPDIVKNTKALKVIVFQFIKCYNLVNLRLLGDSLWHFVKIYARLAFLNAHKKGKQIVTLPLVRDLVIGHVKSKLNSKSNDVSLVKSLQKHLSALIGGGKFNKQDLETLATLLGSGTGGGKFAETFINKDWTDILEDLYHGGTGLHAEKAFQIAVVSLTALSARGIANLLQTHLKHRTRNSLIGINPLIAKIVLSQQLKAVLPGLESELKFLDSKPKLGKAVDPKHIKMLQELFPQLSDGKAKTLLLESENNPETATNKLLENPTLVDTLAEWKPTTGRSIYNPKTFDPTKITFGKKAKPVVRMDKVDEDLQKRTLESALRLLYESDEDEPDDTYESQEKTTPGNTSGKRASHAFGLDEDTDDDESKDSGIEDIERKLFAIFKSSPDDLQRSARKGKRRQAIKAETGWTDEQIEGWARMLVKTPKLFKMLESQFMTINNHGLKQSTRYRKPKAIASDSSDESDNGESQSSRSAASARSATPKAPSRARKEQHKASVANHNRKRGNDKKMAKMV